MDHVERHIDRPTNKAYHRLARIRLTRIAHGEPPVAPPGETLNGGFEV